MNETQQVDIKTSKFKTLVTNIGAAKITAATHIDGLHLAVKTMAFGDAGGQEYEPSVTQTEMINECYRSDIIDYRILSENPTQILVKGTIPPEVGYFEVNEVGLFDEDGDLIAVANMGGLPKYPDATGMGTDLKVNLILRFENDVTDQIVFNIPSQFYEATHKEIQDLFGFYWTDDGEITDTPPVEPEKPPKGDGDCSCGDDCSCDNLDNYDQATDDDIRALFK